MTRPARPDRGVQTCTSDPPVDPTDPAAMSADARAGEVAEILAAGYLRLRAASRPATVNASVSQPSEPVCSRENEVDVVGDQSVHRARLNGRKPSPDTEVNA